MNEHYEDDMEIYSGDKRIDACKLRYADMPEYMVIQDMDIWLKLKTEILMKQAQMFYNYDDYDDVVDREELRYLCFKDKYC